MQNIMGNNMLIAVEAKADYVSAILKVASSALLSKLQYLSAVSRDTKETGDKQRRWQVSQALSSSSINSWKAHAGQHTRRMPASALAPWAQDSDQGTSGAPGVGCSMVTSPSAARRSHRLGAARAGRKEPSSAPAETAPIQSSVVTAVVVSFEPVPRRQHPSICSAPCQQQCPQAGSQPEASMAAEPASKAHLRLGTTMPQDGAEAELTRHASSQVPAGRVTRSLHRLLQHITLHRDPARLLNASQLPRDVQDPGTHPRCRTRSSCSRRELPHRLPRRDQTPATACHKGCS